MCQFLVLEENWFCFLVLAGNSFLCYVRTYCTIQLCGCVCFSVVERRFYYDGKKSSSRQSGGLCCCVSFWYWRKIGSFFVVAGKFYYNWEKKVLVICLAGCAVVSVESFITTGKKSSSRLSGRLCCCVSFWFWREIGFGCTYYYVLGVPYSCDVVLVFLVLVGNSFWCYVRT